LQGCQVELILAKVILDCSINQDIDPAALVLAGIKEFNDPIPATGPIHLTVTAKSFFVCIAAIRAKDDHLTNTMKHVNFIWVP